MNWNINFKLLKKAKEIGHCLCELSKTCPCDEFLEEQKCICGVYKENEEKEGQA